jgi:polar amino acid transport system substrate-binding protein
VNGLEEPSDEPAPPTATSNGAQGKYVKIQPNPEEGDVKRKTVTLLTGAITVSLALGVQACSAPGSTPVESVATSNIDVPAAIKAKGVLEVGSYFNYAPYTTGEQNGELQGIEADSIRAVAQKLGLKVHFTDLAFEAMIPSVINGRSDVLIGPLVDAEERRKQVSFIDLTTVQFSINTLSGNPKKIDPKNLCGTTAAQSAGSQQATKLKEISEQCKADGKPEIEVLTFTKPGTDFLTVTNGRADFTMHDPALATYTAAQNKTLEKIDGDIPTDQKQGWVVAKGNDQLARALAQAVIDLNHDGAWQKIMEPAGLSKAMVTPPTIDMKPVDVGGGK